MGFVGVHWYSSSQHLFVIELSPVLGITVGQFVKTKSRENLKYYKIVSIFFLHTSTTVLRSVHTCVRGSRTPFHKIPQGDFIDDCRLKAISILESF